MRLSVQEIAVEKRKAIPAHTSAAGRYTPPKLTSCTRSPRSREEARMAVERIGDQGGLNCGLQRLLGLDVRLSHLKSTEASKPFTGCRHVCLRQVGESSIERARCGGVGTGAAQGYRGLPCRESSQ